MGSLNEKGFSSISGSKATEISGFVEYKLHGVIAWNMMLGNS